MDQMKSDAEKRRSDPVYGYGPEKYHDSTATEEIQAKTHNAYTDVFGVTADGYDASTFALRTDGFFDDDSNNEDDDGLSRPWDPNSKPNGGDSGCAIAV